MHRIRSFAASNDEKQSQHEKSSSQKFNIFSISLSLPAFEFLRCGLLWKPQKLSYLRAQLNTIPWKLGGNVCVYCVWVCVMRNTK